MFFTVICVLFIFSICALYIVAIRHQLNENNKRDKIIGVAFLLYMFFAFAISGLILIYFVIKKVG